MSLPSVHSLQKKETKKGMLMFISMPWTMATGTASGPEQRAMAAREMSEEPMPAAEIGADNRNICGKGELLSRRSFPGKYWIVVRWSPIR